MEATGTWGEICKPEPISEDAARWASMLAERKTEAVRWANAAMADGDPAELMAALEDLQGWTELQQTDAAMREAKRRRTIRIAVTGHRGKRFDDAEAVKQRIDEVVDQVQRKHPGARWLHGGCWGVDLWTGEAALSRGAEIGVYLPSLFAGFASRWPERCQRVLSRQMLKSAEMWIARPLYRVENYAIRNRKLVEAADAVIAFWDGGAWGGTWQTIRFAKEAGKPVFNALSGWRRL
jgi:hypothetical protein